jgi:hypothetical protein
MMLQIRLIVSKFFWNQFHSLERIGIPHRQKSAVRNDNPTQIAKDSDSDSFSRNGLLALPRNFGCSRRIMSQKTCAACDYKLDANAIEVKIGGKTVEVCCDECAQKLKEAHASASTRG